MAEIITGEFSRYRNDAVDAHAAMKAWMWDCGPIEPTPPEMPEMPKGKEGEPSFELAKMQYRRSLRLYEDAMIKYDRDLAEYKFWQEHNGGPLEFWQWSVDARDTFWNDLRAVREGRQNKPRYYLSGRTPRDTADVLRKLIPQLIVELKFDDAIKAPKPPIGLPKGLKPGHAHQANLERQVAGEREFIAALKADPQFGQEMKA